MRTGPDEDRRSSRSRAGRCRPGKRAGSVVWFDFDALCDGPRSQRDYLELARRFAVLFVSDIPRLRHRQGDLARRFTWLVDILYDHRVKLDRVGRGARRGAVRRRTQQRRSFRAP